MDDQAPPSMYRWSPMRTGWYQPGMAQDAITAVGQVGLGHARRRRTAPAPGVVVQRHHPQPGPPHPALRAPRADQRADAVETAASLGQERRQHRGRRQAAQVPGVAHQQPARADAGPRPRRPVAAGRRSRSPRGSRPAGRVVERRAPSWWRRRSSTADAGAEQAGEDRPGRRADERLERRAGRRPARPPARSARRPSRPRRARRRRPAPAPAGAWSPSALPALDQLGERVHQALAQHVEVGHRVAVGVEPVVDPAVVRRQPDATAPAPWPAA